MKPLPKIEIPGLDPERTLISDTECYPNFWSIGFTRLSDGKTLVMEHSHRREINRARLHKIMRENTVIGYNFLNYDAPMIALAATEDVDNARLKQGNDQIIVGGLKYWQVEEALDISIPRSWDMIDLMEPQPNAFASLKTLAGRMHAPWMQDLPYEPDHVLTEEEMDFVLSYMGNDNSNTQLLLHFLQEAMAMRHALGQDFGVNFMSKSDAQMGEAMIKRRVEQATGERVFKTPTAPGTTFRYNVPEWLKFETPQLQALLERVRASEFIVKVNGKVQAPQWLDEESLLTIGETEYAMGIGGLHSTEKNRAVHSDDERVLLDFDVASYYPAIILNAGLYPKSLGPSFIDVYRQIRDERVAAKRAGDKTKDKGLKIALNGTFGKLGSMYSVLYAPHLMVAITLGGQLALLMLIERAELAGIKVVSGNTDGVVFQCPRDMAGEVVKDRLTSGTLSEIVAQWEQETGFELEATEYTSLYNASVNSYYAFKPDGSVKVKGKGWTGRHDKDIRTQLMKNPAAEVVALAVIAHIRDGVPLEQTIRENRDIRDFVTVVNVQGGGVWGKSTKTETYDWQNPDTGEVFKDLQWERPQADGEYLGKVVRYYWAKNGAPIYYKTPHATTGNFKKVSKSDGARPLMNLPEDDALPTDIDYERYIQEAREVLMDIGFDRRPDPIKKVRLFKWSAMLHFALAV